MLVQLGVGVGVIEAVAMAVAKLGTEAVAENVAEAPYSDAADADADPGNERDALVEALTEAVATVAPETAVTAPPGSLPPPPDRRIPGSTSTTEPVSQSKLSSDAAATKVFALLTDVVSAAARHPHGANEAAHGSVETHPSRGNSEVLRPSKEKPPQWPTSVEFFRCRTRKAIDSTSRRSPLAPSATAPMWSGGQRSSRDTQIPWCAQVSVRP